MKTVPVLPTSRYYALLQLLRTADTVWNSSRAFFARWDLSPSEFNVINLLDGRPEGLSQTALGRELVMHRSNLTGLVDRLEKRGLVERLEVAGDRRAYCVVLSGKGANLLRDILPPYYEAAERAGEHLPLNRAEGLLKDLRQIAESVEGVASGLAQKNTQPATDRPDRAR